MPKNSERSSGSVPFFSCSFSLLAALHDSQKKSSSTPKLYIPSTIKSEINLVLLVDRLDWTFWAVVLKISAIFLKYPTFDRSFFHVFMNKTSAKVEFVYIVEFALKKWKNLKVTKLSILPYNNNFEVKVGGCSQTSYCVPEHNPSVYGTWYI